MKNITTLILVAGKSSRFKNRKSKIFHELAGLPIINHIYLTAKRLSKNDIVFVCNQNNINILKNNFKNCKFVIQKKQNGTANAVKCAKKYIRKNSNILILFGDAPLISYSSLKKMINFYSKKKYHGSMLAFKAKNPFGYGRVIIDNKNVKEVVEELSADSETKKITLCNSGVMICKFNLLYSFIDKINNKNHKKEKYLPDLFKICYQNNKSFSYILCDENEMLGVNTLKDFNKIDAIYQKLLKNKLVENGVKIIDPDSVRISFDTKIASNVVIEPYVYFKTGVVIREGVIIKSHSVVESSIIGKGSVIGPYARIRPKTILKSNVKVGNFVEIKNSTIGDNSKISHLSYIGDSILGKNINIGAGTITCNFNGKIKNKTIIKDNVFVGSNTSLVAPITINANVTIGAGSVVTQNIPQNSLVLERSPLQIIKKKKKNP